MRGCKDFQTTTPKYPTEASQKNRLPYHKGMKPVVGLWQSMSWNGWALESRWCIKKRMAKQFDFSAIDDFERHIDLSIPNFSTLDNIFVNVAKEYAQEESSLVDLGCSTGRFLSKIPKISGCQYIGIDSVDMKGRRKDFSFIKGDCETELKDIDNISVISSMFFLQFLGSRKRARILNQIGERIDSGAIFLIAEKVYLNDSRLQHLIHKLHIQEKRKSFSDEEILEKELQLSVSMFCKKEDELNKELQKLGNVTKVWQSYNFLGYVINRYY